MIRFVVYILVAILLAVRHAADEFLATVLTAEVIPLVEIIHVLILGTVNIVRPPIINEIITIPKLSIPLEANQPIFSKVSPDVANNCS